MSVRAVVAVMMAIRRVPGRRSMAVKRPWGPWVGVAMVKLLLEYHVFRPRAAAAAFAPGPEAVGKNRLVWNDVGPFPAASVVLGGCGQLSLSF